MMDRFDFGDGKTRKRVAMVRRLSPVSTTYAFAAVADIFGHLPALERRLNHWAAGQGKTLPETVGPEWIDAAVRLPSGSREQLAAAAPVLEALMLPSTDGFGGQERRFAAVLAALPLF